MYVLPLLLALAGISLGRLVAQKKGACPHRGKVWGAFALPLLALPVAGLQFQALAVSMAAAVGAGLTAHGSVRDTFTAVLVVAGAASATVQLSGF